MESRLIAMRRNETLTRKRGISRIECARGKVWITTHESAEDIILEPGTVRDFSGMRGLCLQALSDAEVGIAGCEPSPTAPKLLRAIAWLTPNTYRT